MQHTADAVIYCIQMNGSDTNVVLPANGFSSGGVNYRNGLWLADVKEIVQDLVDHLGEELLRLIKRFVLE